MWCVIVLTYSGLEKITLFENEIMAREYYKRTINMYYEKYGEYTLAGLDSSIARWNERSVLITKGEVKHG